MILDNENLTFRGNSIPTKAMEAYMKLVGEKVSLYAAVSQTKMTVFVLLISVPKLLTIEIVLLTRIKVRNQTTNTVSTLI